MVRPFPLDGGAEVPGGGPTASRPLPPAASSASRRVTWQPS